MDVVIHGYKPMLWPLFDIFLQLIYEKSITVLVHDIKP